MDNSFHESSFDDCCSMDDVTSMCSSSLPIKEVARQPSAVCSSVSPVKQVACQPSSDPVKSAAEYVLCLRQGHHISQASVDKVIEQTDLLLKSTLSALQSRMQNILDENNIVLNCDLVGNI